MQENTLDVTETPTFPPKAPTRPRHLNACGTGQCPLHPQLPQHRLRHRALPRRQQKANNTQESAQRQEEGAFHCHGNVKFSDKFMDVDGVTQDLTLTASHTSSHRESVLSKDNHSSCPDRKACSSTDIYFMQKKSLLLPETVMQAIFVTRDIFTRDIIICNCLGSTNLAERFDYEVTSLGHHPYWVSAAR
ncbi:hypothetical protein CHS0354_041703 [Potamilus streckersoni]|uniref:Uncharacterized protein n=1 Tax=Potamilus streckersoni TaxID=2493646 RepID=A0AAE0T0Z4_9BIVA|nr:hypothetical protein CHS0354_041703 [Potamilus streckersoni]